METDNPIIKLFQNNIFLIIIIVILIVIIIYLLMDNFKDTFKSLNEFSRFPPHIDNLSHQQMIPQNKDKIIIESNEEVPNYGKINQENTPENTTMEYNNIYRRKTGRDAFEEEQFVSIYDSNFGGLLGTNMGLK